MSDLTYLYLVNTVLAEGKITLDPLTEADFLNPPRTAMYNNVKRWVNEALRELLTTRNEWFTRKERAVVEVYPRVQVTDTLVPPLIGYVYRGRTSGVEFVVRQIHTDEVIEGSTSLEATLSVEFLDDEQNITDLAVSEFLDVITPAPTVSAARYKGVGYYNLAALAGNAELVNDRSLVFQPTLEDYEEGNVWYETPTSLIPWNEMGAARLGLRVSNDAGPYYVSRTPLGTYSFWPLLNKRKLLAFDYTRNITDMVDALDVPVGIPEKYQMWLVWRAIQEYGDFQQNGQIWSRGNKNAERFMNLMERDNAPEVRLGRGW
ncbi:adaptor (gatekeeper) protein [Stenotrophomonas phage StenR_269]|nr:adaptor (gatekeeper) protein [Stenotrophomonas phage StenR_269]